MANMGRIIRRHTADVQGHGAIVGDGNVLFRACERIEQLHIGSWPLRSCDRYYTSLRNVPYALL